MLVKMVVPHLPNSPYLLTRRFSRQPTEPYSEPTRPARSCSMSSPLPSLLVHRPLGSCRAAWVGLLFAST